MTSPALGVDVPADRGATRTPEERGVDRDRVRLLVSGPERDLPSRFDRLPDLLRSGDLLVVNESATVPASLPARGPPGDFLVQASTEFGRGLWLVEPRWDVGRPGPIPLRAGDRWDVAGIPARVVAPYPGIPRLTFLAVDGDLRRAMAERGRPIRYGYLAHDYPLLDYQTVFARVPGSAEMPSAGRPFTARLVTLLRDRGVRFAGIVLHAGVSSLEVGDADPAAPLSPEPFDVPARTVAAIDAARCAGGRVVAVGTTVVRALESAAADGRLRAARGFTRLYLHPGRPASTVDGLITGFHESRSTHLALLAAVAGSEVVARSYRAALDGPYLWHEFGDSQLLWGRPRPAAG